MAGDIEYIAKSVGIEKVKLIVTLVAVIALGIALYVGYMRIEALFAQERAYMEGVIDTKLKGIDSDIAKRLDNIQIINEQKTIIQREITHIYQTTQKELVDIGTLKNKPMPEVVAEWNKAL